MESSILTQLAKGGRIPFMELRIFFPIDTRFKSSYRNLLQLKLITESTELNETLVNLTEDGMEAYFTGLTEWIRKRLFDQIESGQFVLTKEVTQLEVDEVRRMEHEGVIFQSGKFRFTKSLKRNSEPQSRVFPWRELLRFGGWAIGILVALLGILEYKFGYVAQAWIWIIEILKFY